MAEPKEGERVLHLHTSKGQLRVSIPEDWKITFGAFSPATNDRGYQTGDLTATLRIYETKDKQRACFRDVISFYDTRLPIQKLVVSEKGESTWENSPDGYASSNKVTRKKEWKDGEL